VGAGEAARIATGAPVPDGADTVIRIEDTDGGADLVLVRDARDAGRNVRPAGEDVRGGDIALAAGTVLGPAQIAFLAAIGAATVRVFRPVRVAIVATGDELVPLEQFGEVRAGRRIVSSNSYGLMAAVRAAGAEAIDCGIIADDPALLRTALERAAECDLVLTSAGVSVGEADHMKTVIAELGGAVDFWRVRMRPGSPLAFGTVKGTPWLGLPGNPVSTLVTFELFARPAIRKLMGHATPFAARIPVIVDDDIAAPGTLTHYFRVRLRQDGNGLPHAKLTGPQPSNILSSIARADALLVVPGNRPGVNAGDIVDAIPLGSATQYRAAL
jgi:molybdopterin molybdotransferase